MRRRLALPLLGFGSGWLFGDAWARRMHELLPSALVPLAVVGGTLLFALVSGVVVVEVLRLRDAGEPTRRCDYLSLARSAWNAVRPWRRG